MVFGGEPLPPYVYVDDQNKIVGPGADLVRRVCLRLNTNCSVDIYPVKRLLSMMKNKELNGVITLGKNKVREKSIYFSRAYARTEYGFFTLSDKRFKLIGLDDLQGAKVVTLFGSNMLESLKKIRSNQEIDFDIETETSLAHAFKKLSKGRYRAERVAIYGNADIARHIVRTQNIPNVTYRLRHSELNYYVGFPKNATSEKFVRSFNQAMDEFYEEGILAEILKKYFLTLPTRDVYMN